jgi:fructokinase
MPDEKAGWDRATHLPTPTLDEVRTMLAGWPDAKRVTAVARLEGGFRNRNLALTLDAPSHRVVLRCYDADPSACAKEAALLARLRGVVPVPEVLFVPTAPSRGAPACLVLSFVEGVPLRDLVLSGNTRGLAESARAAGRLLGKLREITFSTAGFLRGDLSVDATFGGLPTDFAALIAHFAAKPLARMRIGLELGRRIESYAAMWDRDAPFDSGGATLVHNDFNSRNLLVRERAGTWEIAAILDWEFAMSGSYLADVGNMLRYERPDRPRFEPEFSAGCRDGGLALPADWHGRARALDLIALVEFLSRPDVPAAVVAEILALVERTVDGA